MPPGIKLKWFRIAVPYMAFESNLQWLSSVKADAPDAAFEKVMEAIQGVLPGEEYRKLERVLSGL